MQKLIEVEKARAIMTEAVDWSVMKWLREKKMVRKAADLANEALDRANKEVKAHWPEGLKAAYRELTSEPEQSAANGKKTKVDSHLLAVAKRVKEADDEAYHAHMDAEDTFDLAEKRLSTSLAREGCHKAILSWDLLEKAIRKAEEAAHSSKAAS